MIKIYGLSHPTWPCPGCKLVESILTETNTPYEFKPIVTIGDDDLPIFDKTLLDELRSIVGFKTLNLPYIIYNDKRISLDELKQIVDYF